MISLRNDTLNDRFVHDLERIATDLIDVYGLKWSRQASNVRLHGSLERWLDFRHRYVEPRPRRLFTSHKFPKRLSEAQHLELRAFASTVLAGGDLNPRQGRGLTEFHDSSGKNPSKRTDALWADWGIHHFHLNSVRSGDGGYYTQRADDLAFCIVADDEVRLIDAISHPDHKGFSCQVLLEIVHRSWPEVLTPFRMPRQGAVNRTLSDEEIFYLRSNGVNYTIAVDGVVYFSPGLGVMSSRTSLKARIAADHAMGAARVIARMVQHPGGTIETTMQMDGITDPALALCAHDGHLGISESRSSTFFRLPLEGKSQIAGAVRTVCNAALPRWALDALAARVLLTDV